MPLPRITEVLIYSIEQHLDAILELQDLPTLLQAGERAMLARLRAGNTTKYDIEFGGSKMSYAHVRLMQIKNIQNYIEYQVESFDFNQRKDWEKIGTILINLPTNNYQFYPEPVWESQKILPPSVFGLEQTERERVIKSCYPEYGGGAWSMQIHHWATSFLKHRSFPQYHPSTFFSEKVLSNQENKLNLAKQTRIPTP